MFVTSLTLEGPQMLLLMHRKRRQSLDRSSEGSWFVVLASGADADMVVG